MVEKTVALFEEFADVISVSGNEKYLSRALHPYYQELADDVIYDNLGSIFAVKRSKIIGAPNVMVTGHLDEAGFIVTEFKEPGFIEALVLGSLDTSSLLGCSLNIVMRTGEKLPATLVAIDDQGTVMTKQRHVLIDIGADSVAELRERGINPGDSVGFASTCRLSANGHKLFGKALSSRYGCVLGIELLSALKEVELPFNLVVGATVQEEVGFRGAQTATNLVKPDLAICLDTLPALETKTIYDQQGLLGKGLLVVYYERTMLPNRALVSSLRSLCEEHGFPWQHYYSLGDSDAGWLHKLRVGAPTLFLTIPTRNSQTPMSVLDLSDYRAAKEALTLFVKELSTERIQGYKEENR